MTATDNKPTIKARVRPMPEARRLQAARKAMEAATVERDTAVRAAAKAGMSSRTIGSMVGLSHTWVQKIIEAEG